MSNSISKGPWDMCYKKHININICHSSWFSQNSFLLECVVWKDIFENIYIYTQIYIYIYIYNHAYAIQLHIHITKAFFNNQMIQVHSLTYFFICINKTFDRCYQINQVCCFPGNM